MDRRVLVAGVAVLVVALAGIGGFVAMKKQVPAPAPAPVESPAPPKPDKAGKRGGGEVGINQPPAQKEQVVVRYEDAVTAERIAAFESSHGLKLANELPKIKAKVYDVPAGASTAEVIGWFTAEPGLVAYAERNGTVQAIP